LRHIHEYLHILKSKVTNTRSVLYDIHRESKKGATLSMAITL